VPISEPINGEPGAVWKNETGRAYYQFIPRNIACAA
jgi:hypothetical protein